jgi:hypothetical protein
MRTYFIKFLSLLEILNRRSQVGSDSLGLTAGPSETSANQPTAEEPVLFVNDEYRLNTLRI